MKTNDCCHSPRAPGSRCARGTVRGTLFAALAVLMPKCPMCMGAWLGAVGLSGLAARIDPRVLWLAGAAALALGAAPLVHKLVGSVLRTVRRRDPGRLIDRNAQQSRSAFVLEDGRTN